MDQNDELLNYNQKNQIPMHQQIFSSNLHFLHFMFVVIFKLSYLNSFQKIVAIKRNRFAISMEFIFMFAISKVIFHHLTLQ